MAAPAWSKGAPLPLQPLSLPDTPVAVLLADPLLPGVRGCSALTGERNPSWYSSGPLVPWAKKQEKLLILRRWAAFHFGFPTLLLVSTSQFLQWMTITTCSMWLRGTHVLSGVTHKMLFHGIWVRALERKGHRCHITSGDTTSPSWRLKAILERSWIWEMPR